MNVRRRGLTSLIAFALVLAGCAGGGGMNPGGFDTISQPVSDDDDLPEWVLALPEGDPPRDTDETGIATLYLTQARGTDDEARAAELYSQALEAAEEGIAADPTNAQPYYQAGEALLGMGDHAAAGEMFSRAEEIYPRYVMETDYLREIAWIEAYNEAVDMMIEETGDPVPAFERANAIYQGRPEAMIQLAALYPDLDRTSDAIELYLLAVDVIEGPRRERIEDPEMLAAWDEAREVALYNVGALLFEEARYAEAAGVYERLYEMYPDDLAIVTNLAASLVSAGEGDRAEALYDELLEQPNLTASDFLNIGSGLSEAGNEVRAAQAFAEAHAMMPQDHQALYNYAQSLYFAASQESDPEAAAALWTELSEVGAQLIEVDTHGYNAFQMLATALVRIEREQEASSIVEEFGGLPFHVGQLFMGPLPDGVAVVGRVTNQIGTAGSEVRLRMHFYDGAGTSIGTEDTTVTLGDPEQGVDFQVDHITTQDPAGFRYEVID